MMELINTMLFFLALYVAMRCFLRKWPLPDCGLKHDGDYGTRGEPHK